MYKYGYSLSDTVEHLGDSFSWGQTPQGFEYWHSVYRALEGLNKDVEYEARVEADSLQALEDAKLCSQFDLKPGDKFEFIDNNNQRDHDRSGLDGCMFVKVNEFIKDGNPCENFMDFRTNRIYEFMKNSETLRRLD